MFAQVRDEVSSLLYNVRRSSSLDEKIFTVTFYLYHLLSSGSLLPLFTVRDRDGTIGKVYRLLPQAGAGVTVHRQVGSVNALTGGHSPSPTSLPGLKM